MPRPGRALLLALPVLAGLAIWLSQARDRPLASPAVAPAAERRTVLLFTSLPITWAEAPDIAAMLADKSEPHWARTALEARGPLHPIDVLDRATLTRGAVLVMAQPRPLAPSENVALDAWVAGGGRVLLFADPALTADSAYAVGDRRRPEAVALLSPILTRWGLRLEFDEDQPFGERDVALDDAAIPVNLPGRFAVAPPGRAGSRCGVEREALVATCRVGRGKVIAVADAALFDAAAGEPDAARRRDALDSLLGRLD